MARIFPFPALRYDPVRVDISHVVTQPYDKITPAMRERYCAADPYNLVRIILPISDNGDPYEVSANLFRGWRAEGVLKRERASAIYACSQQFGTPGTPGAAGHERRGFIALGQLEDYARQVVFRHEQTLTKPKVDRLNLLRATRAHFGQIFMLYSDPKSEIEALLPWAQPPDLEFRDDYAVLNRLWLVNDPNVIRRVQGQISAKRLIIADGHHRYETALIYRDECRAADPAGGPDAAYERVMMTFVNMDSEGLVILPTHRVVSGLCDFSFSNLRQRAADFFEVEEVEPNMTGLQASSMLQVASNEAPALLAVTKDAAALLHYRPTAADVLLADLSPLQRILDVVLLHRILLQHVLGISDAAIREQKNIEYLRDAGEGIARVQSGANVAFLMNPVRIEQVRDLAFAGEVLPQKSTDFYPKLLSGLTIYALDEG